MMMTKRAALAAAGALSLLATPITAMGDEPQSDTVTLNLFNLTDVHGHIEQVTGKDGKIKEAGLAAMSCYLDKARKDNPNSSFTLLGDNIGASPFTSGILKDNPTIAALNKLNPLASTVGNHEFDMGVQVFKDRIDGANGFEKVEFPYLGANVVGLEKKYMGDYVVWTSDSGIKVAFIGAIAEDVPYKLSRNALKLDNDKKVEFTDPHKKIEELADKIKANKEADIVIAMLDDDTKNNYPKMPKSVDGLMGGDTHVPYSFTMQDTEAGHKISAISSGSYTDNLANLQFTVNKDTHEVIKSEAILIPAAEVAQCGEDEAVKAIVDKAVADSKAEGSKVVATGMQPFYRGQFTDSEGKTTPGSNRGIESSLGDLAADAMKHTIKTVDGKPVDIGLINAGGLRADLIPNDKGEVTYADTFAVMPFSNQLGYVTITGAKFKEALEEQWKTNLSSQNSRPLLKLGISSNVSYTYDPAKPRGERITSVLLDGKPMDMDREYTIGSVTFLLNGGDSFPALTSGGDYKITAELDREYFNDYLRNNPGLSPRAEKSAIGLTLPTEPVAAGESFSVQLRGLSFSEGPSITKKVTLTVGDTSVEADVNNDLTDANANNEKAIITTDGAGRAEVNVKPAVDCSKADDEGIVRLPVTVNTDFAQVVTQSNGLSVSIQCAVEQPGETAQPGQPSDTTQPGEPGDTTKPADGSLAVTGADVTTALTVAAVLLLLGAILVGSVRHRMR